MYTGSSIAGRKHGFQCHPLELEGDLLETSRLQACTHTLLNQPPKNMSKTTPKPQKQTSPNSQTTNLKPQTPNIKCLHSIP